MPPADAAHKECWEGSSWLARALLFYVRRFPGHRGKTRLWQALGNLLFRGRIPVVNADGVRLDLNIHDYIGGYICTSGEYEPLSLALSRKLMRAGGWFVDIGANFGLYTCSMGILPNVRCLAIEPQAAVFVKLQEHLALNSVVKFQAFNGAIGKTWGLAGISAPHKNNLGAVRVELNGPAANSSQTIFTTTVSLGDVCAAVGCDTIQLAKIDIEGNELEVLESIPGTALAPKHLLIEQVEALAGVDKINRVWEILGAAGYTAFSVTGERLRRDQIPPEDNVWWRMNCGADSISDTAPDQAAGIKR